MNYRHIYHAGNICDVVKHVTLLALIAALKRKDAPFAVIDTHAGCGLYDLDSPEARKTGEADAGIRALVRDGKKSLPPDYQAQLAVLNPGLAEGALRFYPGSPLLALGALRPQDRYIGCELHEEDFAALRRNVRDQRAQLHGRDGYEGLAALTPPPEKRGLVLCDPPFEQPDEFARMIAALQSSYRRWNTGIFALWYAIKDRPAVWRFHEAMIATGIRKQLTLEFIYDEPKAGGLHGSGMLVVNPPWQFDKEMAKIYGNLHGVLARPVAETKIAWLVPE